MSKAIQEQDVLLHRGNEAAHKLAKAYIKSQAALVEFRYLATVGLDQPAVEEAAEEFALSDRALFEAKAEYERVMGEAK